jgi:uncharacterized protein (DUF1499 family)
MPRQTWKDKRVVTPVVIVASLIAFLVLYIDDWGRDFTTNEAFIDEDASDPGLRAPRLPMTPAQAIELVRRAAGRIRNWEYVGEVGDGDSFKLLFVRTSRLLRFKDDVTIRIESRDGLQVISGESRSRIGFGDLGQNPRTLRRFLAELNDVWEGSEIYERRRAEPAWAPQP